MTPNFLQTMSEQYSAERLRAISDFKTEFEAGFKFKPSEGMSAEESEQEKQLALKLSLSMMLLNLSGRSLPYAAMYGPRDYDEEGALAAYAPIMDAMGSDAVAINLIKRREGALLNNALNVLPRVISTTSKKLVLSSGTLGPMSVLADLYGIPSLGFEDVETAFDAKHIYLNTLFKDFPEDVYTVDPLKFLDAFYTPPWFKNPITLESITSHADGMVAESSRDDLSSDADEWETFAKSLANPDNVKTYTDIIANFQNRVASANQMVVNKFGIEALDDNTFMRHLLGFDKPDGSDDEDF